MICLSRGPTWLIGSSLLKSFIDYTRCPTHCGPGEWRSNQAPPAHLDSGLSVSFCIRSAKSAAPI